MSRALGPTGRLAACPQGHRDRLRFSLAGQGKGGTLGVALRASDRGLGILGRGLLLLDVLRGEVAYGG